MTAGPTTTTRSLLAGLLRDGASAAIAEPRALPEGLTELRRERTASRMLELLRSRTVDPDFAELAEDGADGVGPRRQAAQTAVLRRASRFTLIGPLAFRVLAVGASLLTLLVQQGLAHMVGVLVVGTVLLTTNVVAIAVLLARVEPPAGRMRAWLFADLALGLAGIAVTSVTVPTRQLHLASQVSWTYLVGTAVLWTVAWGAVWGFGLVVGGVVVHPLNSALNHLHDADGSRVHPVGSAVQDTLWMLIGVLTAVLALLVLGIGTRLAMAAGIRAGREVERSRLLRGVHDTVLQTLEVAALSTPDDRMRPATTLSKVRRSARVQAGQLRRALDSLDEPLTGSVRTGPEDEPLPLTSSGSHVVDDLGLLVDELAAGGFAVELVVGDLTRDDGAEAPAAATLPADGLSEPARAALLGATREALRNSAKHAGTDRAVVHVDRDGDVIRVVVRDHGRGFDPRHHQPGFGVTESIHRRLSEVGGFATINSRVGRGTRVTLRVGDESLVRLGGGSTVAPVTDIAVSPAV